MTPWTVAYQTPLFMEFSRQEWSELSVPTPGDLLGLKMEPASPVSPVSLVDSSPAEPSGNAFKKDMG